MVNGAKNYCFTINNPTDKDHELVDAIGSGDGDLAGKVTYIVMQLEQGDSGTPHYQGFVQFKRKITLTRAKDFISERAHVEVARGTAAQSEVYCTKAEGRIRGLWRFGTMIDKGKRTDLDRFVEELNNEEFTEQELISRFPNVVAKYPRFVLRVQQCAYLSKLEYSFTPRPGWQSELSGYLSSDPHPRQVRWYWDEAGNTGKSWFANHYFSGEISGDSDGRRRPYVITGGKWVDIYYAYKKQLVVIFDWPRDGKENFPYSVLECFKNGYFLSTKYEPVEMRFKIPHCIIFANFLPDQSRLSADRWEIINL